jgi:hypothetical protein
MEDNSVKEYWFCFVGPIDRSFVPEGGDWPPRQAVRDAMYNMTGIDAICSSGWGMDEEEKREIEAVQHKHFLERNCENC